MRQRPGRATDETAEPPGAMMSRSTPGRGSDERSPNRLAGEKSPYLLQHALNPVDWYPWGSEAFEKARSEDRPIFLSIGYSTCHWCHVMERESFEDSEVAALMNRTFVSIKVDREERPDIDGVYMSVATLMTGRGGWPLTIIMTPDGRPFYAATYLPRESRFGLPGLLDLSPRIGDLWANRRSEILESADAAASAVRSVPRAEERIEPGPRELDAARRELAEAFDAKHGGFGIAPKFPTPHRLVFLLRQWKRTGDERALDMVERSLTAMRNGGIYDHLGFGFHRYSTDTEWLVPHFEKMLYDQALLAVAYTEAYLATRKADYAKTARETLSYVLRDMRSPEGGFYSAEDADSEGVEGKFYVWTSEEVRGVLGEADARIAALAFGVCDQGNFIEEATGRRTGANILHRPEPRGEIARSLGLSERELERALDSIRTRLLAARRERVRPPRDDKILTDWNGLTIAALALSGRALGEPAFVGAAARAADFILSSIRDSDGRLLHRYRDGDAAIRASADDYAFLIWGLLELYEATFDPSRLEAAVALNEDLLRLFWDENGGLYFTAEDAETLLTRRKEVYDGATPSANSVALLNLLRLGRMTGEASLESRAAAVARAFGAVVSRHPSAYTHFMTALDFAVGPSVEIVIVGAPDAEATRDLVETVRASYLPRSVTLLKAPGDQPALSAVAPWTDALVPAGDRATAYVCRDFRCELPATDPAALRERLSADG
jgi:uncharacterized protein YyaL (SSP411 family)